MASQDIDKPREGRGFPPFGIFLDLFSNVRLGIVLLVVLFVYCSVGSAGIWYPTSWNFASWAQRMPRQWAMFEMTEFEWFHTPFFLALCALICLNLTVTTVRRIPPKVVNLGVWMIHAGVIVLVIGSVIYFGTKVEGDTPVFRRLVRISSQDGSTLTLPALAQRSGVLNTPNGAYRFTIAQIDPDWPLLSAGAEGQTAYSVTVQVETGSRGFMRQVLDGHPEFTEDVIPGRGRAVNLAEFGTRIIDDSFTIELDYLPQSHFWVKDSSALGVREVSASGERGPWSEVPIRHLPRYNDRLESGSELWSAEPGMRLRSLDIPLSGGPGDVLGLANARVTGYLRYATLRQQLEPGSGELNPTITLALQTPMAGDVRQELAAFDPQRRSGFEGLVVFQYAPTPEAMDELIGKAMSSIDIEVDVPGPEEGVERLRIALGASDADWTKPMALGETGWSVRVGDVLRNLALEPGRVVSLAILEIRTPEGETFTRWVFEDASRTRDLPGDTEAGAHGGQEVREPDARIRTVFSAGVDAPLVILAGPGGGLKALVLQEEGSYTVRDVAIGESFGLTESSGARIDAFNERARRVVKPWIVPVNQRNRNADISRAMALMQIEVETASGVERVWLPFHQYSFADASLVEPGLGRGEPTLLQLADGRFIELIFTRERRALPALVVLEDFVLTTHVGGYSGETSSVRDWTSVLRFWEDGRDGWSETVEVASNKPVKHDGLQYFQAFWDAPPRRMVGVEAGAEGMNFTGLGVGNRRGVGIQLAGSALSVIGMMYAFYVKPIIKRRRRTKVLQEIVSLEVAEQAEVAPAKHVADSREEAAEGLSARRAAFEEEHI